MLNTQSIALTVKPPSSHTPANLIPTFRLNFCHLVSPYYVYSKAKRLTSHIMHDLTHVEEVLRQLRALVYLHTGEVSDECLYGHLNNQLQEMTTQQFKDYYDAKVKTLNEKYHEYASMEEASLVYPTKGCNECKDNDCYRCRQCWWDQYPECRRCSLKTEAHTCFCDHCNCKNSFEWHEYLEKYGLVEEESDDDSSNYSDDN